ncbi:junctional cadherin 5-associated protein [Ochotona princeps]|uniref:junctional cadherin 5-associated protein n=1 Tax=Ochotona princeps TaxID=9978 RepID=UPI00271525D1|nr:junctional cadherin 5-associated protein [Ochotona princeps]
MAQAHSLPAPGREGPWEVGRRMEQVTKKAMWEEELRRASASRWQEGSGESWCQPGRLGRQMSEGDGRRLLHDLCPMLPGEPGGSSQTKRKSQSLPRMLSPESLSYMEVPIPLHDGHLPGVPRTPPYPNCAPSVDLATPPEKAPLPRPKFGRPLKHARGMAAPSDPQTGQHKDPHTCRSEVSKPRHEPGMGDPGLEPPMYVPPPSYRSPPQNIPNPYLEDTAPPAPVSSSVGQQPPPPTRAEKAGSRKEWGASPCPPHPAAAPMDFIQYIPFSDPRLRHIKLAWPHSAGQESALDGGPCSLVGPVEAPALPEGTPWNAQNLKAPAGDDGGLTFTEPSAQWPWGQLPRNRNGGGSPDTRDHRAVRDKVADKAGGQQRLTEGQVLPLSPVGEIICRAQVCPQKSDTGPQSRKRSKKKMNETIFCLVSIPVQSESQLPDTDTNNNDLKQSTWKMRGADKSPALQEQGLRAASSTDLELQALTGTVLGSPTPCQQERPTSDLRFLYLTQHRELTYTGSGPGHQYRDQQTQTTFSEDPSSPQMPAGAKPAEPSPAALMPPHVQPTVCDTGVLTAVPSRGHPPKPTAQIPSAQASLSPSSSSAFSRTSSCTSHASAPKAGPGVDGRGLGADITVQPEVVKGEAAASPCNSQQPFGQFLLKPVSRRPWDLISQLESFNKELQEEEESCPSSSGSREESEESEVAEPWEDRHPSPEKLVGFPESPQERRAKQQPKAWALQHPEFRLTRATTGKSGSWNEEAAPSGWPYDCPRTPWRPLQVEDGRGEIFPGADGDWVSEKRNQAEGCSVSEPVHSPGPARRAVASRPRDMEPAALARPPDPRELQGMREPTHDVLTGRMCSVVPPQAGGTRDRGLQAPLSLAARGRGLSAPDLRSVGLAVGGEQHRPWGESSALEIPPGETLQARAARILGIEVAVESLLPDTRQSQSPEPEARAHSPKPPQEASSSGLAPSGGPTASADAFYGRRKCGWTESPLFVGERDGTRRAPPAAESSEVDGVMTCRTASPEPQPGPTVAKDGGLALSFRSTLFHVLERTPSMAGSEKKLRSPSKVIESIQEKLACPSRRADPSRLMRMKEVNSVSRMRCLSSRNTDATAEDARLPAGRTCAKGPSPPLSWENLGHPAAQRERPLPEDSRCPDSYDPSRVERV